jgi:hypothetical protein
MARFTDNKSHYALYDVTRADHLFERNTLIDYDPSCFLGLPLLAHVPVTQVQADCTQRGWCLVSKEGDRPYPFSARLFDRKDEREIQRIGTVIAATPEEARERTLRVLLREFPTDLFRGHASLELA